MALQYPVDYKYTKEHEWLKLADGVATIGITDHAQNSLGDIVFVELPAVGATLTAGTTFGSVESVKAVSDLFAPASGTVTEVNAALTTAPETINTDPHGSWMLRISVAGEPAGLLSAAEYEAYLAEEGH